MYPMMRTVNGVETVLKSDDERTSNYGDTDSRRERSRHLLIFYEICFFVATIYLVNLENIVYKKNLTTCILKYEKKPIRIVL